MGHGLWGAGSMRQMQRPTVSCDMTAERTVHVGIKRNVETDSHVLLPITALVVLRVILVSQQ
jgi:hypothetical protein